jgi:hypothetical protein
MVLLALVALVWVICLAVGAAMGIILKVIWFAVLFTIASAIWYFIKGKTAGTAIKSKDDTLL